MALILFLNSLFGLLSVIRIVRIFHGRALIATKSLTKIGTLACSALTIVIFLIAHHVFAFLLSTLCLLIIVLLTLMWLERRQIDTLKNEVPRFFDRWILNLKLGHALSSARDAALRESSDSLRALLQPMFRSYEPLRSRHLVLEDKVLEELRRLERTPHSALARLENLRTIMRKSDEFRRKSGQATRQTSIQSLVLLVLQFALSVFTVHRYGFKRSCDFLVISILLSAISLAVMRWCTRKRSWTL